MQSNMVPGTSTVEQSDFLPVSGRSALHFNIFEAFSNGRLCYFVKWFLHSVYKEISEANVY